MKIVQRCMRAAFIVLAMLSALNTYAAELKIELELPKLDVDPYHKPYVAIWIETAERKAINTIALWVKEDTWFKDLRQWWRKLGRGAGSSLDGITGATRLPGKYTIHWQALDASGKTLPAGEYLINVEASREEGGRSYAREKIIVGKSNSIQIASSNELGEIHITTE